jgi:Protein of unknown function (DUF973)
MAVPFVPGGSPPSPPQRGGDPRVPETLDHNSTELAGLSNLRRAAVVAVVGSTLWSLGFLTTVSPGPALSLSNRVGEPHLILGMEIGATLVTIFAFWLYAMGFARLRGIDAEFVQAPVWATVAIVGLLLQSLAVVVIIASTGNVSSCTLFGEATAAPTCPNVAALLGGLAMSVVGEIVLFIGYIGTIIFIWRLGARYWDPLFRVGAILLIFPFLSIVGQILVLAAASRARTRVQHRPGVGIAPAAASVLSPPLS